jgi:hypothetical protein
MFISRAEKQNIEQNILNLLGMVDKLKSDVVYLTAKVKVLEGSKQEPKKKRGMSPENRAKLSKMMKDRHAKKKLDAQNTFS